MPDQKIIGFALGGGELRVLSQAYRVDGKQQKLLGEADIGGDTAAPASPRPCRLLLSATVPPPRSRRAPAWCAR